MKAVDVAFTWQGVPPRALAAPTAAVVVDTLRATTTLVAAFTHGLEAAWVVGGVAAARRLARAEGALLGGERDNRAPAGFAAGNSPFDYPAALVRGQRLVFTSTNGARALTRARAARRVALGALINAAAAARTAAGFDLPVLIICAGTRGLPSLDDVLAAGAIAAHWPAAQRSDAAQLAVAWFERWRSEPVEGLRQAAHAAALAAQGFARDVAFAGQLDWCTVVPQRGEDGWLRPQG